MRTIHLGIIPDGNRRFMKKNKLSSVELVNHWCDNMIVGSLKQTLDSDFKNIDKLKNVKNLSFYISSIDNVHRNDNSTELGYQLLRRIHALFKDKSKFLTKEQCVKLENLKCNIRFNVVGEYHLLPEDIRKIITEFKSYYNTKCNNEEEVVTITLAIAYDYKNDLTNYGANTNKNYNRVQPQIDCVFRTGNEFRTSGFFPCHILYAELVVLEKLWPEIELVDLCKVIDIFNKRNRRFGK